MGESGLAHGQREVSELQPAEHTGGNYGLGYKMFRVSKGKSTPVEVTVR